MCERCVRFRSSCGPLTAITNPISCFRESEPPACFFWPPTKSQKYENDPSIHSLQLFNAISLLTNRHPAEKPDLTGRTQLCPLLLPTATPLPHQASKQGHFKPFVRPHNSTTTRPGNYCSADSPDKVCWLPLDLLSALSYAAWLELFPAQRVTTI